MASLANRIIRRLFYFIFILMLLFVVDRIANNIIRDPAERAGMASRIPHSYYHHGLESGIRVKDVWGDEKYTLVTNSLGCKSDQKHRITAVSEKDKRVLFIGDSFTEGVSLPFDKTFVGIIDKKYAHVEVLNGGISSYSPKLDYLKARYLIEEMGLTIDKIIVYTGPDDIYDEFRYCSFRIDEVYAPSEKTSAQRKKFTHHVQ